ncbi:hypothetical protein QJS10_CPB04g00135 [Acorus calamus]|uniref:phosphopyruvate hydratase n=1 Tax=Acorus calamus TaxID=4465 RepID=A0AAV9EYT0_ACOCL|nr:hypothetical protein QJS10_CPB04g00135 [Acorus calamus]
MDGGHDLNFKKHPNDGAHVLVANSHTEFVRYFPIVSIEDHFDQDDWRAWDHYNLLLISN